LHFDATFERLAPKLCRFFDSGSGRLNRALSKNASPELLTPSALQIEVPLFFAPSLERTFGTRCHVSQRCHPQGLATLSVVSAFLNPWKPLSASDTLGVHPSELFSSSMIERERFPSHLSLSLFCTKPSRLGTGAPAISSHRRSRAPSCFPGILVQGGAYMLSWAFGPFGHSLRKNLTRGVSPRVAPFVLSINQLHNRLTAEP
jgi:hypothetical protein